MLDLWRWQYLLLPEYSRILLYTVTETFNIPTYTVTIMYAIHLTSKPFTPLPTYTVTIMYAIHLTRKPFTPLPIYHYTINQQNVSIIWVTRQVSYKKQELRTLCEHLGSSLDVDGIRVAHRFRFRCCVFCCIWLRPVSCVPKCCQCLWVVHCWLPLRFSLTLI